MAKGDMPVLVGTGQSLSQWDGSAGAHGAPSPLSLMAENEFIEIHVDTPLAVAESRDVKGLYKKARAGEIKHFTGIDSPYEAPQNPELRINTVSQSPEEAAEEILGYLKEKGFLAD